MNTQPQGRQLINEVLYLASLASSPQAIDPLLDTLRVITAKLAQSGEPNVQQQTDLRTLKQKLEHYLVAQEPVRVFTPESLQLQVDQHMSGGSARRAMLQLA